MKRFLIILGLLLGLFAASGAAVAFFVDWTAVRAAALARLGSATGLEIAIDGGIDIRVLPRPAVRITGVRLAPASAEAGHTIAAVDTIDLVPSFGPLLRGEVAFEQIALAGLSVSLEHGTDGRGNWEALTGQFGGRGGSIQQAIAVGIERGTVFYVDRRDGTEAVLAGIGGRFSAGPDGLRVDARFDWGGLPFTAVGALAPPGSGGAALFDFALRMDRRLALTAAGRMVDGGIETGRFKVESADLPAAVSRAAPQVAVPAVFKNLALEGTFGLKQSNLQLDALQLRVGSVSASGSAKVSLAERLAFDAVLNVSTLPVDPLIDLVLSLPAGSGGGRVAGRIALAVDAAIYRNSAVRGLKVTARVHDGAITVERAEGVAPGGTRVVFDGQAAPRGGQAVFEGSVKGEADDLRAFLTWLGVDLGGIPPERFRRAEVESALKLDDWHLILDGFRFKVDAVEVTGKFAMPWRGQAPIGVVLDVDHLDLDAYAGAVGGDSRPGRALDGQITARRLTVAGRSLDDVRIDALWNGVEAKVRGFGFALPGNTALQGLGTLSVAGGEPRFVGRIQGGNERPADLAAWFGFTPGPGLFGRHRIEYAADVDTTFGRIAASGMTLRFDESTFTGSISAGIEAGRPKIVADIRADYWAVPLPKATEAGLQAPPRPWSPDRFDFNWASGFDLDLVAAAGRLQADRYLLEDVRLEARLREKRIGVQWLEGKGYGGDIRARGFLDANAAVPRYLARIEFAGIGLRSLLMAAAEYGGLDGTGNLYAELSGTGASEAELVKGTEGTVKITGTEGSFEGVDVDLIGDRLRQLQNIGDIGPLLGATEAGGQTRVQQLAAEWTLSGGIARSENLRIDMRTAVLEAKGGIDVVDMTVDLNGDLRFTAAAGEPSLGVRIRGPVAAPVQELTTDGLRAYIQKRINDQALNRAEPPPAIGDALPETIELPQVTPWRPRR